MSIRENIVQLLCLKNFSLNIFIYLSRLLCSHVVAPLFYSAYPFPLRFVVLHAWLPICGEFPKLRGISNQLGQPLVTKCEDYTILLFWHYVYNMDN